MDVIDGLIFFLVTFTFASAQSIFKQPPMRPSLSQTLSVPARNENRSHFIADNQSIDECRLEDEMAIARCADPLYDIGNVLLGKDILVQNTLFPLRCI